MAIHECEVSLESVRPHLKSRTRKAMQCAGLRCLYYWTSAACWSVSECASSCWSLSECASSCCLPCTDLLFSLLSVPCPNLYIQLNGLTFTMDPVSLLWGNLFCLDLYQSLEQFKSIYKLEASRGKDEHLDVRLDAFWLKVGPELGFVTCGETQLHSLQGGEL